MANVLGELFSDIAGAIRDLTGESSSVKRKPTEFAEKIREVAENGGSSGSDTSGLGYALMSRKAEYTSGDKTFLDVGALKSPEGSYYASIVSYSFAGFTSVTHVRTKATLYFESNAFLGDENLKVLDVTCAERAGMIGFHPNALNGCSALESVIIRRWSEESAPIDFVSFQTGSTTGAGTFYVYVPSADYDTIVSKLPTSEVPAERFRKLEEYPAVDKWAETYTVRFWDGDTLVGEKTVKCGESASLITHLKVSGFFGGNLRPHMLQRIWIATACLVRLVLLMQAGRRSRASPRRVLRKTTTRSVTPRHLPGVAIQ